MTATDLTGFYAFSLSRNGAILSTFWGHNNPGEKGTKNLLEKTQKKKNPVETAPQNCRFLFLVVVKRVLTKPKRKRVNINFW